MIRLRAAWVLPIDGEPIRDGCVTIDGDRIACVAPAPAADLVDLGQVALLPGLVNAHTHLELSHLHGQVPPAAQFHDWARALLALRGRPVDPGAVTDASRRALAQARAAGTALVGDVSNTLSTVPVLAEAAQPAHVFHELLGFNLPDAAARVAQARTVVDGIAAGPAVRVSLAAHAPYSVSPALFAAIRGDVDRHARPVTSVHLGESPAEVEFLRSGTGPMRALLESLGAWNEAWQPPAASPVEYLDRLGFLTPSTLVVHGVQFGAADLARLAALGSTVVSCPRSNVYVGVGSPPLEAFYAAGIPVAFGTDSLSSVADLNLFSELREARRLAPRVAASALLHSATLAGAGALGFGQELGSLEAGKRARLIAVRVPEGVVDVEEYLLSGIDPVVIRWVPETI